MYRARQGGAWEEGNLCCENVLYIVECSVTLCDQEGGEEEVVVAGGGRGKGGVCVL